MSLPCVCPDPGDSNFQCERHDCKKSPHWWKLCQTRDDYRDLWDRGGGPCIGKIAGQPVKREPTRATFAEIPCPHRREVTGSVDCELCGFRGEAVAVAECSIHGKCTPVRWAQEHREKELGTIACLDCPDRPEVADEPEPEKSTIVHVQAPNSAKPFLTIGMAVYDDFAGAYMALQSLRLYFPLAMPSVELVVVNNNPNDTQQTKDLRGLCGMIAEDCRISGPEEVANVIRHHGGTPSEGECVRFFEESDAGLVVGHANWSILDRGCLRELSRDSRSMIRRSLRRGLFGIQYIELPEPQGTSAPRDKIFRVANGKWTICIDSHVMLDPNSLTALFAWMNRNDKFRGMFQGPVLWDSLRSGSTHFGDQWRDGMWGTWQTNWKHWDVTATPFEIQSQGLGLFGCRTDCWLGFNPAFRGFGGEEWYIHEKYRQAGEQVLCLPFLRWLHRFGDGRERRTYSHYVSDIVRNYLIGHAELNLDMGRLYRHFVEGANEPPADCAIKKGGTVDPEEWQRLLAEAKSIVEGQRELPL